MNELEFATKTLKDAYKKCIKGRDFSVKEKVSASFLNDYVTNCDEDTEKYIVSKIKKYYPHDNIVSEEFNSNHKCEGRCWVLDPIDGTVNFSKHLPMWCIQIAFVVDGETKCAAIYCPTLNEMYTADKSGAYLNGTRLDAKNQVDITSSIINVCDLEPKSDYIFAKQMKIIENIGKKALKIKAFGSAGYEFCMVASGRINAYIIFYHYIWDSYPGLFICKQAGCCTIHKTSKKANIALACTNEKIKEELLSVLED